MKKLIKQHESAISYAQSDSSLGKLKDIIVDHGVCVDSVDRDGSTYSVFTLTVYRYSVDDRK